MIGRLIAAFVVILYILYSYMGSELEIGFDLSSFLSSDSEYEEKTYGEFRDSDYYEPVEKTPSDYKNERVGIEAPLRPSYSPTTTSGIFQRESSPSRRRNPTTKDDIKVNTKGR